MNELQKKPRTLMPVSFLEDYFANTNDFYDVTQEEVPVGRTLRDFYEEMHCIDARHRIGQQLMQCVANGQEKQAMNALSAYSELISQPNQKAYPTGLDPLRDFKNSTLSMNTTLRLAIENNHVPNLYINHCCSRFSHLIEKAETFDEVAALYPQMIRKYCYLARHYSMAAYSPCIKNCLLYIEMNLSSELSTSMLSEYLGKNVNSLSAQFKKEVGINIVAYIRQKRIQQAKVLLRKTDFSVQDIASQVGIPDANYFTKQFKAETGITPMQYRTSTAESVTTSFACATLAPGAVAKAT